MDIQSAIDEKIAAKMRARRQWTINETLADVEQRIREKVEYIGQRGVPKPGVSIEEVKELYRLRDVAKTAAFRFYRGQPVSIADYLDAMIESGGVVEKHYRGFKIVFNGGREYYPVTDRVGIAYLREFHYRPPKEE